MASIEKSENEIEPNTALLSAILMIGTFVIAYQLRSFKSGKFLGRSVSYNFDFIQHLTPCRPGGRSKKLGEL